MDNKIRCEEFTPKCDCGKPIRFHKIQIAEDRTVYLIGYCHACRSKITCPITMENRKAVFQRLAPRSPLVPPLAIPAAVFTQEDAIELHGLGVSLPADE